MILTPFRAQKAGPYLRLNISKGEEAQKGGKDEGGSSQMDNAKKLTLAAVPARAAEGRVACRPCSQGRKPGTSLQAQAEEELGAGQSGRSDSAPPWNLPAVASATQLSEGPSEIQNLRKIVLAPNYNSAVCCFYL